MPMIEFLKSIILLSYWEYIPKCKVMSSFIARIEVEINFIVVLKISLSLQDIAKPGEKFP